MDPSQVPPQSESLLQQAGQAFNAGDPLRACQLAEHALRLDPGHPEGHYLAGLAALAASRPAIALDHLREAVSRDPGRADYAVQFARALCAEQRTGEALAAANHALGLRPTDPIMLLNLGCVYVEANAHERALSVFRQAASAAPGNAFVQFNLAMALIALGDTVAAEGALETCLSLRPDLWRAHGMLSQLRRQTPQHNHIQRLGALAASTAQDVEAQLHLHTALGKEYEDLGDPARAFVHFSRGKAAVRRVVGYDARAHEALVDALVEAFPAPLADDHGPPDEPIFIVGMPRTGTTLVERIVSSHPEVYSAGELENFPAALERLAGVSAGASMDARFVEAALRVDPACLGAHYLDSTRPMTAMKPRFTDKRPHNFLHLGFIARALPRARIICLQRDPMDTCLSNFREAFNPASPSHRYAFDLLDIGRYYLQFRRLMAHWKRVLPGRLLEIDYETVVAGQEASSRKLLAHCDLPWNDSCLRFEENAAPTATASSLQVRSPIYRTSMQRWRKYEKELEPLRRLLEEAGVAIANR
jgi:tetratricopeptide (TPR) repeat protein